MTLPERKPDALMFQWLLEKLRSKTMDKVPRTWREHLFHFTDITTFKDIVHTGNLLSRLVLQEEGHQRIGSGSAEVLDQTDSSILEYVRLYFRPRTPTAYVTEGIRPADRYIFTDARCPVPVYLLFDLQDIITLRESRFSKGSLAVKNPSIYHSVNDFMNLPFNDIYSDYFPITEREKEVKFHRQAEVVIPKALSLRHLKAIICRTTAEYETMRNLLENESVDWMRKARVAENPTEFFHMHWLHITSATLAPTFARLQLNRPVNSHDCGPFNIRIEVEDHIHGPLLPQLLHVSDVRLDLPNLFLDADISAVQSGTYTMRVYIEDSLVYYGKCHAPEVPF